MPEAPAPSDDRSYPKRPFLGVSCAVWYAGKVLLVQRGRPPKQDYWALPGGLVETGETCADAACREILEETGLLITDPFFVELKEIIEPDRDGVILRHFVLAVFTVIADTDKIAATDDAKAAAWVGPDKMTDPVILAGIGDAVAKSRKVLEDQSLWDGRLRR